MDVTFENILFIGPNSKRKGGIAMVLSIYKENFNASYFASTNFQSTFLSFLFLPERLFSLFFYLIKNKQINIVHIHGSSEGSFYRKYLIFLICKWFKKKVVYHVHSGRFLDFYLNSKPFIKSKIEKIINTSDIVIVLSDFWKEQFLKGFNQKHIEVVPNIISKPIINEMEVNKHLNQPLKILFLGKIFKAKGIYDLLDCIIENYNDFQYKFEFIIAGNGEEDVIETYKKRDNNKIIKFLGWIDLKEKQKVLTESNVLILPSYSEGSPISILEAMGYKLPIIATAVGGIPELVNDSFNGKIIAISDKKDIYNSLMFYHTNRNLIVEHGDNSFEKIQKHFPKNVEKKLISVYNKIN